MEFTTHRSSYKYPVLFLPVPGCFLFDFVQFLVFFVVCLSFAIFKMATASPSPIRRCRTANCTNKTYSIDKDRHTLCVSCTGQDCLEARCGECLDWPLNVYDAWKRLFVKREKDRLRKQVVRKEKRESKEKGSFKDTFKEVKGKSKESKDKHIVGNVKDSSVKVSKSKESSSKEGNIKAYMSKDGNIKGKGKLTDDNNKSDDHGEQVTGKDINIKEVSYKVNIKEKGMDNKGNGVSLDGKSSKKREAKDVDSKVKRSKLSDKSAECVINPSVTVGPSMGESVDEVCVLEVPAPSQGMFSLGS